MRLLVYSTIPLEFTAVELDMMFFSICLRFFHMTVPGISPTERVVTGSGPRYCSNRARGHGFGSPVLLHGSGMLCCRFFLVMTLDGSAGTPECFACVCHD
jgi:hypothetical protein